MEFKRLDRGSQLYAIHPAEVTAQARLDWPIFDADGALIAERGELLPSKEDRDFLFIHFQPHRPVGTAATAPVARAAEAAAGDETAPIDAAAEALHNFRIQAGTILRIKTPPGVRESYANSRVIGHLANRALFVTPPLISGKPLRLLAGEEIQLLGFSGKSIFEFTCSVESVCMTPFEYLILSRPLNVRRVRLRRSVRVTTRIACWLALGERFQGRYDMLGIIRDMSELGVSLGARPEIARPGERLHLRFAIRTHEFDIEIRTPATVRNVTQSETDVNLDIYGVEFETLAPVEKLALQCFVQEQSGPAPK